MSQWEYSYVKTSKIHKLVFASAQILKVRFLYTMWFIVSCELIMHTIPMSSQWSVACYTQRRYCVNQCGNIETYCHLSHLRLSL